MFRKFFIDKDNIISFLVSCFYYENYKEDLQE